MNRTIYACDTCDIYYSETFATPIAGLTTPLSRIALILKDHSEGMGLNATARTFKVSKTSVLDWACRLAKLKPTLLLYALLHEFIHQGIEGDELYTKVNRNKPPHELEGWTIVLMECGSCFLWEFHCGRKDQQPFEKALTGLTFFITVISHAICSLSPYHQSFWPTHSTEPVPAPLTPLKMRM